MDKWMESRGGDIGLRVAGGMLLLSAWYECRGLRHIISLHGTGQATLAQLALAALLFLSTSFGSILLILGRHIGDRITLPDRWARRFPVPPKADR